VPKYVEKKHRAPSLNQVRPYIYTDTHTHTRTYYYYYCVHLCICFEGLLIVVVVCCVLCVVCPLLCSFLPQGMYTIGREKSLKHFRKLVTPLLVTGYSKVIMVEGTLGVGKTHILRHVAYLNRKTIHFVWGIGDPIHKNKPHYVWTQLFDKCKDRNLILKDQRSRDQGDSSWDDLVQLYIREHAPELVPYLHTANSILGTKFKKTTATNRSKHNNANSVEQATKICVHLLQPILKRHPVVFVLDQAQCLSSEDWATTLIVSKLIAEKKLRNFSLWIGCRPISNKTYAPKIGPAAKEYFELTSIEIGSLNSTNKKDKDNKERIVHRIMLKDLAHHHTHALLCRFFSVQSVDPVLADVVHERTGGRPLFCLKLAKLLKKRRAVVVTEHDNKCGFSKKWMKENSPWQRHIPVPYRVARITSSHIDILTPSQLLLLKLASVICMGQGTCSRTFRLDVLHDTHPIRAYRKTILEDLQKLEQYLFITSSMQRRTSIPYNHKPVYQTSITTTEMYKATSTSAQHRMRRLTFAFRYGFLREVIYELMLFKQRRNLHQLVADFIESRMEVFLSDQFVNIRIHKGHLAYLKLIQETARKTAAQEHDDLKHQDAVHRREPSLQKPRGFFRYDIVLRSLLSIIIFCTN